MLWALTVELPRCVCSPYRSGFLVGPCQQVKLMMKPVRCVAAVIYLVMIVVVLAVAIAVRPRRLKRECNAYK